MDLSHRDITTIDNTIWKTSIRQYSHKSENIGSSVTHGELFILAWCFLDVHLCFHDFFEVDINDINDQKTKESILCPLQFKKYI